MLINFRRNVAKKFPSLRNLLSPIWVCGRKILWILRNFLSGFSPVEVRVKNDVIRMFEGHIAEVIWGIGFEQEERNFVEKYLKPGM